MIPLGVKARDKVTGFEGIVISRTQYIAGCARYGIQPPVDKDGKVPELHYFDETMIEVTGKSVLEKPPGSPAPG